MISKNNYAIKAEKNTIRGQAIFPKTKKAPKKREIHENSSPIPQQIQ